MSKLQEIYDGWKNTIFPNPEIKEMAEARAKVCATCINNVMSVCKLCGCPLVSKTKSPTSQCPENKWPK